MAFWARLAVLVMCVGLMPRAAWAETRVAVPELDYKSEVRTYFYYESASSHARARGSAHVSAGQTHASVSGSYASSSDSSYVKNVYDQIHISYGELRGMTADVRAVLLKNGYAVVNAPTHVATPKQTDDFFNLNKRIKAGEFGKAQYVLYGIVVSMDVQTGGEPIAGTNTQMSVATVSMTVDYRLVETATLKTVASFSVLASGNDNRLGNGSVPPSTSKIVAQISKDLAAGVAENLAAQRVLPVSVPGAVPVDSPSLLPMAAPEEEVKIYRPDAP